MINDVKKRQRITSVIFYLTQMIEEITSKKEWDKLIGKFNNHDFHHGYDYHDISKEDGTPTLLKYTEAKTIIVLPLLIRSIKGTKYKDATSVYGYAGPLTMNVTHSFNNSNYKLSLLSYFKNNDIISVFSRLNPYIPLQQEVLREIGDTSSTGKVVNINLSNTLEHQVKSYSRRLRGQINKLRKNCSVISASNKEELQTFIGIYNENMDRVQATPQYYFDDKYYTKLTESVNLNTKILLAVHNETGEIIAGSMFIAGTDRIHYHLSGTKTKFLSMMPTKLLIDEMRILACEKGYVNFNLGGGLGGEADSLFDFKTKFSKDLKSFYVWKLIVNRKIYNELSTEDSSCENSDYFPAYRIDKNSTCSCN